jgi:hypothetical protein
MVHNMKIVKGDKKVTHFLERKMWKSRRCERKGRRHWPKRSVIRVILILWLIGREISLHHFCFNHWRSILTHIGSRSLPLNFIVLVEIEVKHNVVKMRLKYRLLAWSTLKRNTMFILIISGI